MKTQDAAVIKALAELGLSKEPVLSPAEEDMLARALDPEKEFLHNVEKLFKKDQNNVT